MSKCHHSLEHGHHSHNGELRLALASGVFLASGFLVGILLPSFSQWKMWLYVASFACGGWTTTWSVVSGMRRGKIRVDALMLIAAVGAAVLGELAEGTLLLFLFSLGHAWEHLAMGRARQSVSALAQLAPPTALRMKGGVVQETPVESLQIGDRILARPYTRIAADGIVVCGNGGVDEANITGESLPQDKGPADDANALLLDFAAVASRHRVFAGTLNQGGVLEIIVLHTDQDSTLRHVGRLVEQAESSKSSTQRASENFEKWFVPTVIAVSLLVLVAAWIRHEPFASALYRALTVLTAASPCGLAIATPSAVLSGVSRGARGGVLFKGGEPLEQLGVVQTMIFDKTGTLTIGRPIVTEVIPETGVAESEFLRIVLSLERRSTHPLAIAAVRELGDRVSADMVPTAEQIQEVPGRGISGTVEGRRVWIGGASLLREKRFPPPSPEFTKEIGRLHTLGRTLVLVAHEDRWLGALGWMDPARPTAKQVIGELRRLGMRRILMMSGDRQDVAEAMREETGIDDAWGELLPADKELRVRQLIAEGPLAMVGDGVNDAPALATATVGIAMGAAASEIALRTASVALMTDELWRIPFAIRLSRATRKVILQNLWLSLGVAVVLVPAAMLGLRLGPAVLIHEGSTVLVVLNALRLLRFPDASNQVNFIGK